MNKPLRYEPLGDHLRSLKADEVKLTYGEVEQILGRKLPVTAYSDHYRQWWANTKTHSQGAAWLAAGWRVWSADRVRKRVEFRRLGSESIVKVQTSDAAASPEPPKAEAIMLHPEQVSPAAFRLLQDVAEEHGGSLSAAVGEVLERAARERRRQMLDWFAANTTPSTTSSVELIREDRDGR